MGQEDTQLGREQFTNNQRPKRPPDSRRRTVTHAFRAPPPRNIKTKKELDDTSSVATAGGSSAGSVSGVSSKWSRPLSRVSHTSFMSSGPSIQSVGQRRSLGGHGTARKTGDTVG